MIKLVRMLFTRASLIANANVFVKQYITGLLMFRGWGWDFNRLIYPNN